MPSTGFTLPTVGDQDTTGLTWANPGNITIESDATFARISQSGNNYMSADDHLLNVFTSLGSKALTIPAGSSFNTYSNGGSADLWGASLTPEFVNSADFGLGVKGVLVGQTRMLRGSGFNLAIPLEMVIVGAEAQIRARRNYDSRSNTTTFDVAWVKINVHYELRVDSFPFVANPGTLMQRS